MRLAWSPLLLLLIYLLLVFLICRLFDLIFTSHQSITPTAIVDPIILSVRQLKLLLEHRGVSYTGYVEKKELVHLVEASADLVQGEVDEITLSSSNENDRTKLLTTPQSSYFSGSDHFYEQVEDTKDSVWLVQVIPSGSSHSEPLLDDYNWRVIQNQVAPFSIRTGIFHCKLDKRLCNIKGWYEPLLLLAMPRGSKPKDKVVIRSCKYTRPQVIMEWMREQLSIRVNKITDLEEIEYDWLQSRNNNNNTNEHFQDIKVLLLTHLLHPPLFLAALSIKFTGRIKFGMFSVKKEDSEALNKRLSLHTPSYLVITPERTIVYGQRQGEHFHYWAMNALLRIIQPEMNDVFICSLLIINMMASLQVIQMSTGVWWIRIMSALWIYVKYNFWLFIGWLVIYGTQRWPLVILMMQYCQVMIRYLGLSDLGSIIQRDCQLLFKHPYIFFISFLDFAVFMKIIRDGLYTEGETEHRPWLELFPLNYLFRRRSRSTTNFNIPQTSEHFLQEEMRIHMFLERLSRPDLWLQPVLPAMCYVKDLPVWIYQEKSIIRRKGSFETLTDLMDGDTPPWSKDDDEVINNIQCPVKGMISTIECAICLELYIQGVTLCGLPCGHNYHEKCVMRWFQTDSNQCPICRWPVYKTNHPRTRVNHQLEFSNS